MEEEAKAHLPRYLVGIWKKQVSRRSLGRDVTSSCETSSLRSGEERRWQEQTAQCSGVAGSADQMGNSKNRDAAASKK